SRSAPSTVGRPGCAAQPRKGVPLYSMSSRSLTSGVPDAICQECLLLYEFAHYLIHSRVVSDEHQFLLQRVQPAMVGLVDGFLSTLAPIFSIALASHNPRYAFIAGLATSIGAGVSMG